MRQLHSESVRLTLNVGSTITFAAALQDLWPLLHVVPTVNQHLYRTNSQQQNRSAKLPAL